VTRVLLRGGQVHTPADPGATALLTDGDAVAWTGSDSAAEDIADAGGADLQVVDLAGALVTPAFVDAHVHATSTGIALEGLDLTGCPSLAQALDRLEQHARRLRGGVILGHGWDETGWPEGRPPTRQEVDRASYGGVVYLTRIDVHSAVASSALLAAAPDLRGLVGYDPDGVLSRQAHHAARAVALEAITAGQRRDAQHATLRRAAELGIGALHEIGGPEISSEDDFRSMLALATEGGGPDVIGYWGELGGVDKARELGALGAAGDLFADGALGSHTACLRTVYADDSHTGVGYLTAAEVRDHVIACTQAGLQGGFHVIGDGAMDAVLAGLQEAAERVGVDALRAARHRLEHVEMIDGDGIAVLARLGVFASVQPVFDALWGGEDGMYVRRLGAERARGMNPFAAFLSAGVPIALGSDSPVTPLGPWAAVRAAAYHQTPESRLSVRAAFAAHTRGGWRAAGRDDAGLLVPGAPATYALWEAGDLVVRAPDERVRAWSTDPRSRVPGLPDVAPGLALPRCLRTVVRGATVYDADEVEAA
jgi:predicted amidohydrolase YtcJ